ncbi:MAG: hypothetical protein K2X03_26145 [Bryobacteraceae bacterium]|nr:hypothetical protein [Bryobacteraceae bacterium]
MTKKIILSFATLALALSAETHNITLFQPTVLNGKELKPGDYKLELKDSKAVISHGKESVEAAIRVENADAKFGATSVRYTNGDGKFNLKEIRLRGTKTKVVFGEATNVGGSN